MYHQYIVSSILVLITKFGKYQKSGSRRYLIYGGKTVSRNFQRVSNKEVGVSPVLVSTLIVYFITQQRVLKL